MQYKHIMDMLAEASKKKVRPGSSKPSQIKERNFIASGVELRSLSDESASKKITEKEESEYSQDEHEFESTPSQIKKIHKTESDIDIDEDAMIDAAEKVFLRIADQMFQMKVTVR